jgi:hypothetical protein
MLPNRRDVGPVLAPAAGGYSEYGVIVLFRTRHVPTCGYEAHA